MNKIVLNDGTEIENGIGSASFENTLYIKIPGNDLAYAVGLFSDVKNNRKIFYINDIYKYTFIGYTKLRSIGVNKDNNMEIYLTGSDTQHKKEIIVPKEYMKTEWEMLNNE